MHYLLANETKIYSTVPEKERLDTGGFKQVTGVVKQMAMLD